MRTELDRAFILADGRWELEDAGRGNAQFGSSACPGL